MTLEISSNTDDSVITYFIDLYLFSTRGRDDTENQFSSRKLPPGQFSCMLVSLSVVGGCLDAVSD